MPPDAPTRASRRTLGIALTGIAVAALIIVAAVFLTSEPNAKDSASTTDQTQSDNELQTQLDSASIAYEQSVQSSMPTVSLGETVALVNTDTQMVSWDGTIKAAIESATLFGTTLEASATFDLGSIFIDDVTAQECYGDDCQLLVLCVWVENVDATPFSGDYFAIDAFTPYYPTHDGSIGEVPWDTYMPCELASFNGAPDGTPLTSPDANNFELAPDETKELTIGYWVPGSGGSVTSYLAEGVSPSTLVVRPSLNASTPGTLILDLGLSKTAG